MKSTFDYDPMIRWSREICLYCHQPTGPDSGCENIQEENNLLCPPGTFSIACPGKAGNGWIVDINFPVSRLLLARLEKVAGVAAIVPLDPYKFKVIIANLHDEAKVKQDLTAAYKDLIKSIQSVTETNQPIGAIITSTNGISHTINFSDNIDIITVKSQIDALVRDFKGKINVEYLY